MRMEELIEKQYDKIFVHIDKIGDDKSEGKNIAISVKSLVRTIRPPKTDETIEEIKEKLQAELANLELDEYDLDQYLRTPQKLDLSSEVQLENQYIKDIARLFTYQRKYISTRKRLLYLTKIIYALNKPEIEDDMDFENNGIKQDITHDRLHTDE